MKIWRFAHANKAMWQALPVNKKAGERTQRVMMLCSKTLCSKKRHIFVWWAESCAELLCRAFPQLFQGRAQLRTGLVSREPPTQLPDRACAPVTKKSITAQEWAILSSRGTREQRGFYERVPAPMFWLKWKWEFSLLAWRRRRRGQQAFHALCILRSGWIKLNATINFITGYCWQICLKYFVAKSVRTR